MKRTHQVTVESEASLAELPGMQEIEQLASSILSEICRLDRLHETFHLSVSIVEDEQMRSLNEEQRGIDKSTDVLSFPMLDFPVGPGSAALMGDHGSIREITRAWPAPQNIVELGDVVIARGTCLKQARENGVDAKSEFLRLLIHGVLHLFGYDHETGPDDEQAMQARELEIQASCAP